jgi:ferrochelatase
MTAKKLAIVLFNLGGPDGPEAVRPFLFNLFNDPAIFNVPQPFRSCLAAFVSKRRAPVATEIYRHLGGGSPLLANTEAQAEALQAALGGGPNLKVFIAMRYWHPFTSQTVSDVQAWGPDEIVLLPLYPQFSTTSAGSSLKAWARAARSFGLNKPTRGICCYPTEGGLIKAMAARIVPALAEAEVYGKPRLLLSAHGLPEKIVKNGDPYQFQCEQTAVSIVSALDIPDLDWTVCYQSRVGPLKWIGPSTDAEIHRGGLDRVPLVVAPLAFVSEHSETLVEIEIEYRKLARECGVPHFVRVPAVGTDADFIDGLASLVQKSATATVRTMSGCGHRICPTNYTDCSLAA